MLLAQAMQLLQILLSTSGRGQVYTITAPPTCQAGQIIVGKGRVLINYCVLKKCRYFHVLIHRLISITTVSVNTSFLLQAPWGHPELGTWGEWGSVHGEQGKVQCIIKRTTPCSHASVGCCFLVHSDIDLRKWGCSWYVYLYRRHGAALCILHTTAIGSPPKHLSQWPADVDIIICILITMYMLRARKQSAFTVGKSSSINT